VKLLDSVVAKIHSTVRWNKPIPELEAVLKEVNVTLADAVAAPDPKNGNYAVHVSAQNGHMDLTQYLIENKADVNAQNGKGQTPLHMSVEYDFYFQTVMLLEHGADGTRKNGDGHEALKGIDGGKEGAEAWDSPITILKAAGDDKKQLDLALTKLEEADPETLDKAQVVQAGMAKKRTCKENWDATRFMALMKKL